MQHLKRVSALVLILAITLTSPVSVLQTPTHNGTVAAQDYNNYGSEQCDLVNSPFFISSELGSTGCEYAYNALENLEADATADELHSNIYIQAEVMEDDIERSTVEIKDESGRSKQLMLDEGLYQFIKCYNQGGAVTECKSEGLDGVETVASGLERKLIESQNLHAIQVDSQIQRIRSNGNIQASDVYTFVGDGLYVENETVELLNGEKVNTTQVYSIDDYSGDTYMSGYSVNDAYTYDFDNVTWSNGRDVSTAENIELSDEGTTYGFAAQLNVRAPASFNTVETLPTLNHRDYRRTHDQILTDYALAQKNFVDIADLYAKEVERGEIDATDVLSPFFLADKLSSGGDNIDPQQAQQLWAEQQGLTTDSSSSFIIDYTQADGTTRTEQRGSLAISSEELDTLSRGETFNVSNYSGNFYFYPDDSEPEQQVQLTGKFEIVEIKTLAPNGTETGNTSTANVTNSNPAPRTTSTKELRKDITEKVNNYENRTKVSKYTNTTNISIFGGGSFDGFPSLPSLPENIWIVAGVGIAALAIIPRLLDALLSIVIPFR
jgi:hypothetical protein